MVFADFVLGPPYLRTVKSNGSAVQLDTTWTAFERGTFQHAEHCKKLCLGQQHAAQSNNSSVGACKPLASSNTTSITINARENILCASLVGSFEMLKKNVFACAAQILNQLDTHLIRH